MAISEFGSSMLQIGANTLGGLFQSIFGNKQAERAWRQQAEYNSPVNQMARLKQAGLNPHLIYGGGVGGASGNMNTAPNYTAPTIDTDYLSKQQQYTANELQQTQIDTAKKQQALIDAQERKVNAEELMTLTNIDKTKLETSFQRDSYNVRLDTLLKSYEKVGAEIGNIQQNTAKSLADTQLSQEQKLKVAQEIDNLKQTKVNLQSQNSIYQLDAQLKKLEISLRKQGINPNDPAIMRVIGRALDESGVTDEVIKKVRGIKDLASDFWKWVTE